MGKFLQLRELTSMERFKNVLSAVEDARMHELLRGFDGVCRHHSIPYVIEAGTLIGSMLHHDRIPWDDDADVYVRMEDRTRLLNALQRNAFKTGPGAGKYSKVWSMSDPRVANHKAWNWPFVDIGWLVGNETHMWEARSADQRFRRNVYPKEWLFPAVLRPFGALMLSAPRNSQRFLEYRFGHNWSQDCVLTTWNHKLEQWRHQIPDRHAHMRCDVLNVNVVHRVLFKNGTTLEWLVNPHTGERGKQRFF